MTTFSLCLCALLIFGASPASARPIKVGVVMDQTTIRAAYEDAIRGLTVGVELLRKKSGTDLRLDVMDSGPMAVGTRTAMLEMVKRNPDAIIAEISSSKAEVAAQVAEENKRVMVTPFATARSITQGRRYVFRPCAGHERLTAGLVKYLIAHRKMKTAGVIFDEGQLYSTDLTRYFIEEFERRGGVVLFKEGVLSSQQNFNEALAPLKKQAPDFLFLPMYEDVTARVIAQIKSEGAKALMIIGADGWQPDAIFKAIVFSKDDRMEGYYITHHNPSATDPAQLEFEAAFRKKYGVMPATSAAYLAYDSLQMIAAGVLAQKKKGQGGLRESISQLITVDGVTGLLKFGGGQDPVTKTLYINKFRGPELVGVEPL